MKLFNYEKYNIIIAEFHDPVKPFDEKLYICETCHKHFYKNKIPCQSVCNKMALNTIAYQLKYF